MEIEKCLLQAMRNRFLILVVFFSNLFFGECNLNSNLLSNFFESNSSFQSEFIQVFEENLGYNESRSVSIFWRTTDVAGDFNLTVVGEISGSDFVDLNETDNILNLNVTVKPRNFQLSVEMRNLPNTIYLNQTLEISVSALNFGPEICCECPDDTINMTGASADCIGAEISLFIDGELFEIYQTCLLYTSPSPRDS